jgi:hypothetical protein
MMAQSEALGVLHLSQTPHRSQTAPRSRHVRTHRYGSLQP